MTSKQSPHSELSPYAQKILAKHKAHEMEANQWDYLVQKTNPEDHSHCVICRASDLEWNYDIDRFSRHLWSHQKNRPRNASPIGTKSKDFRTSMNFNDSPMKVSPVRRARSTSIGEKTDLSSPIRRDIPFNVRNAARQAEREYHNIHEEQELEAGTDRSEKMVLDELYQIYSASKHDNGKDHHKAIDNTQTFNPFQTPKKVTFSMSPSRDAQTTSRSKEERRWEDSNNNYAQSLSLFNPARQENNRFNNQEFDSQISLGVNNGEFNLQSERSTSYQQTGRRSRNDRKRLKEENSKIKVMVSEPYSSQQEMEDSVTFKSSDKGDDGISEQNMVQQEEKTKERRLRKDRLKKRNNEGEQEKLEVPAQSVASKVTLPDKYSESNIEFETENLNNHSFSQRRGQQASQSAFDDSYINSQNQIFSRNQGYSEDPRFSTGSFNANIEKMLLSNPAGRGFSGYKLPINESRTFVDTERDGCSSNRDRGTRFSNRDSDPRQQRGSLPLRRSDMFQKDVLSNEEVEDAEGFDHDDAYERIMSRFLRQEPKMPSSSRKHLWNQSENDKDQELENFVETENQLLSKRSKPTLQDDARELPEQKVSFNTDSQENSFGQENTFSGENNFAEEMEKISRKSTIKDIHNLMGNEEAPQSENNDIHANFPEESQYETGQFVNPSEDKQVEVIDDFDTKAKEEDIMENKQDHEPDNLENKYKEFEEIIKKALPLAEALTKGENKADKKAIDFVSYPKEEHENRKRANKRPSVDNKKERPLLNNENEKDQKSETKTKSKPTIFNTNITWEKLRLFRKVEQKAAGKIQDFYTNKPKDIDQPDQEIPMEEKNQERKISEDEFSSLISAMKKHEDLYYKMKQGINSKGEDLINLSIAFISAYCSLKTNDKSDSSSP